MNEPSSSNTGPSQAPDFKQVRSYLRTIQQREALGGFIRAGWSPAELAEFARQVFLAPAKSYPTAASYQYAMEKGADHPYAVETLAALRAPGFTMPPFDRPEPKVYDWDDPDSPEHTSELRAEVAELARIWLNREADKKEQPWPTEAQPVPRALWRRLYRIRNKYHSLHDTVEAEGLREFSAAPASFVLYGQRAFQTDGYSIELWLYRGGDGTRTTFAALHLNKTDKETFIAAAHFWNAKRHRVKGPILTTVPSGREGWDTLMRLFGFTPFQLVQCNDGTDRQLYVNTN